MSDLAAFLLARIAEDTDEADRAYSETLPLHVFDCEWETFGCNCVGPARVRVELEAKRQIVELHRRCGSGAGYCDDGGHGWDDEPGCADLAIAASVYAGHPDFDEAWRL